LVVVVDCNPLLFDSACKYKGPPRKIRAITHGFGLCEVTIASYHVLG
jgi:hypothetical protein